MIAAAVKPWHRKRHGLFPRTFTPRVVLVLLVQQRLDGQAALFEQQQARPMRQTRRRRRLGAALRVRLTVDIWLESVVPFLPRFGAVGGGAISNAVGDVGGGQAPENRECYCCEAALSNNGGVLRGGEWWCRACSVFGP